MILRDVPRGRPGINDVLGGVVSKDCVFHRRIVSIESFDLLLVYNIE
jgi:hypothetical protein